MLRLGAENLNLIRNLLLTIAEPPMAVSLPIKYSQPRSTGDLTLN